MQRKKIVKHSKTTMKSPIHKIKTPWHGHGGRKQSDVVMSFWLFRWDVPLQHSWALAAVTLLHMHVENTVRNALQYAIVTSYKHPLLHGLQRKVISHHDIVEKNTEQRGFHVTRPFHRFLLTKFTIRLKTTALVTPMTSTPRTMPRSEEITFPAKGWGKKVHYVHSYYLR